MEDGDFVEGWIRGEWLNELQQFDTPHTRKTLKARIDKKTDSKIGSIGWPDAPDGFAWSQRLSVILNDIAQIQTVICDNQGHDEEYGPIIFSKENPIQYTAPYLLTIWYEMNTSAR